MFYIQMGYPGVLQTNSDSCKHIEEVFPGLFHIDEEAFFVFWRDIPIRFRYREDLERNFSAILAMLQLLNENSEGSMVLVLVNEILNLKLDMRWQARMLHLNLHVETDYRAYEEYAAMLNEENVLEMDTKSFMAEWHTLIHQLVLSFHVGKVYIESEFEHQNLESLQKLDRQLEGYGWMYTEAI